MKLIISNKDLLKSLNHVQSVVERRNAIPILSNVRIDATADGDITLTTTDMDISIKDFTKAKVERPGSTTVPAHMLYEIIRKVSGEAEVVFDQKDEGNSNVELTVGKSEFNLPCLPVTDFPNFEVGEYDNSFTMNSEILRTLFSKTKHAISNEETRYYLNGIYFHAAANEDGTPQLRCVATDGHRLAWAQTAQPEGCQDMPGVIIPKKTVGEVIKLLEDYVGDVKFSLSQNKATLQIGTSTLHTKLIDGKFPDYNRVIPEACDKTVEVSRDKLARSIDLVISVSSDRTRAVKFNIEPSKLLISATSEMNGNAKGAEEIEAKYDANDNLTIGFNSKYVLDSLGVIEGDTVKLSLSDGMGAVVAQDANEANCKYILMPMQI